MPGSAILTLYLLCCVLSYSDKDSYVVCKWPWLCVHCVTFVPWFLRFEVYIDNVAVACAADFVDVGSAYLFELPSGEPGKITVKPTKRTDRPVVELFVNNTRVGRADGGDDESKK